MTDIKVVKTNSVLIFDYPWEISENLFDKIMDTIGSRVEHEYIDKNIHLLQSSIAYFNKNLNWPYKIFMESKGDGYLRLASLCFDDTAHNEAHILSLIGLEAREFLFQHFSGTFFDVFKNIAYTHDWFFTHYNTLTSADTEDDTISLETISRVFVTAIMQTCTLIRSKARSRESFNEFVYEHKLKFTEEGNIYDPESNTTIELTKFQ